MSLRKRSKAGTAKKDEAAATDARKYPEQPMLLFFSFFQKQLSPSSHKRLHKMLVRSFVATVMFVGAYAIYCGGHLFVAATLFGLQVMVFKELLAVRYELAKEKNIPYFRTVVWMWFIVACFFLHGHSFMQGAFGSTMFQTFTVLSWQMGAAQMHEWLSFSLYVTTFCLTVLTLKKEHFQYQMQQLAWTLLTIALVGMQSNSTILNVNNGLFWVVFPGLLVIINDVMAYFCGQALGRKIYAGPFLPDLSPNKTWEGFVGAGVFTAVAGYYLPLLFSENRYMMCSFDQWTSHGADCNIPSVFLPKEIPVWPLSPLFGEDAVPVLFASAMQLHGVCLAIFASAIAPFGGFFASAIKRAFGIKDFGVLFPGHGGFTDRLDCQFIMALCTNVHFHTFIAPRTVVPILAIASAISSMENPLDLQTIVAAAQRRLGELGT